MVIETKEQVVSNPGEFNEPIGKVEVVREGSDLTILSYGSTFNLCVTAGERLASLGVDVELIDAQTLLPFDIEAQVAKSLEKTNRLLVVDEDVSRWSKCFPLRTGLGETRRIFPFGF